VGGGFAGADKGRVVARFEGVADRADVITDPGTSDLCLFDALWCQPLHPVRSVPQLGRQVQFAAFLFGLLQ